MSVHNKWFCVSSAAKKDGRRTVSLSEFERLVKFVTNSIDNVHIGKIRIWMQLCKWFAFYYILLHFTRGLEFN